MKYRFIALCIAAVTGWAFYYAPPSLFPDEEVAGWTEFYVPFMTGEMYDCKEISELSVRFFGEGQYYTGTRCHPAMTIIKDNQECCRDFETAQLGMRSDGVVVWRKGDA